MHCPGCTSNSNGPSEKLGHRLKSIYAFDILTSLPRGMVHKSSDNIQCPQCREAMPDMVHHDSLFVFVCYYADTSKTHTGHQLKKQTKMHLKYSTIFYR